MALSGTINGSCDNSRYTLTCEWSATQNVSANTSTITAIVYLNGNGYTTSSSYWSCVINGTTVTSGKSASIGGKTELGRRTWTVNHNSDGSCSTTISFSYSNGLSSAGTYTTKNGSGSGSITLNTIPRASSFTLNTSSGTLPCNFTVNINRASSSFTHTVTYKIGSNSYTKANKTTATSVTVDCGIGDCNVITNSTSGTATIIVDTYSGTTKIGSASKTVTLYVPSSVVPSVGISVTPNNQLGTTNISGRTTFTVKATNASGAYGSTIKSYSISGGYINSSSSSATSGTLSSGTYTFTVKVTDSRGRTAQKSQAVTVYSYSAPTLSVQPYRADSSGNAQADGTYVYANLTYAISNPNNSNTNAKKYLLYKRTTGNSAWTQIGSWTNFDVYSGTVKVCFGEDFATTSSYELKVDVKDTLKTTSQTSKISTIACLLNIEEDGIGIGKIYERGALDVAGKVYSTDSVITDNCMQVGRNKVYYGLDSNGNQIQMMRIASHNGVDVGYSGTNTAICSANSPTWWNGTTSYDIFNSGNCTITSGSGGVSYRFANGLQINTMQIWGTWNITTAWGSVYSSPFITPSNYTQTFLTPPQVTVSAHGAGTAVMVCQAGAPTTTTPGSFYLWKPTQQTGVRDYIEIISIGRWK